jgi:protein-tyrosine phosphatase
MIRVCFVCLGNICRSPTAEGVMRHLLADSDLAGVVEVESAGTAAYHAGEPPDRRSTEAARRRGIRLSGQARQFSPADWQRFDHVLAVDASTLAALEPTAPAGARARLALLRSFDDAAPLGSEVPDPYYGGSEGFETVLDQCEAACRGLISHLRRGAAG